MNMSILQILPELEVDSPDTKGGGKKGAKKKVAVKKKKAKPK